MKIYEDKRKQTTLKIQPSFAIQMKQPSRTITEVVQFIL